ncbi:uncharacterized protein LOC117338969 [Pecten maximus]|uniref:uncharacterized protein LOC117338969 n=1 Tax=Pecten maximus TaxID=6579 RepID=UPI001458461B|nr:uncharacterized protein LOC117338969 [Pecten maximus]
MALDQFTPPEKLNFKVPEEWLKWEKRFQRFRVASSLVEQDQALQVYTLIYAMGQEAEEIFSAFELSEEKSKTYQVVKERFDSYFIVRRNVFFERAKFNQRKQMEDEHVETFITSLHALSEHCGYRVLREEMIRDRLVVGLKNIRLSEKIQLDANLAFEKALTQARQSEAVKKQQSVVRNVEPSQIPVNVDRLSKQDKHRRQRFPTKQKPNVHMSDNQDHCGRCGYRARHALAQCPAKDAKCYSCQGIGHFRKFCRSKHTGKRPLQYGSREKKKIHEVTAGSDSDEYDYDDAFLGSVSTDKEFNELVYKPLSGKQKGHL